MAKNMITQQPYDRDRVIPYETLIRDMEFPRTPVDGLAAQLADLADKSLWLVRCVGEIPGLDPITREAIGQAREAAERVTAKPRGNDV